MYKYKKRFINSTKPSTIFDSNGNEIGVVQKYYKNIFEKIIRNVSFEHFFERYLFKDENDNIIVMAKKTGMQQKRNYRLTYFEVNSGVYNEIHLSNEERFNKEKLELFKYEDQLFSVSLDKKFCKMVDTQDNKEVASWSRKGDYIYIKFKGGFVEKHKIFTIAILHTFSNNNIRYYRKDIGPVYLGPPPL